MSMLIVEMEMPQACPCEFAYYSSHGIFRPCFAWYGIPARWSEVEKCAENGTRPDWCPIVGVLPDEHGDLIDRDRLEYRVMSETNPYGKPTIEYESGKKVMQMIENAFTVIPAERKDDSTPSQGRSLPCWADGPDGCEELTYHGMAECLRHCVEANGTDCRYDCQYVERDTGACLHEYLISDAADYLDKAAATIEKMKKVNTAIAAERKDDEQIH